MFKQFYVYNTKYICVVQDAFILDTGAGGIFAWLGSGATQQEKKAAFKNAVVSCHSHKMRSLLESIMIVVHVLRYYTLLFINL